MSTNSIKEDLEQFKTQFEPFLENKMQSFTEQAGNYNPEFIFCLSEVNRLVSLSGAKRIRPFLVKVGYDLFTKGSPDADSNLNQVLTIGAALELFHTYALIHDDIIDEAEVRRGEPTIETIYKKRFGQKFSDKDIIRHNSQSATILAGDLALFLADQIMNQVNVQSIRDFYYRYLQFELAAGQIDDCFGVGLADLDTLQEKDILTMIAQKSGNYSIQKPLLMGALLAGVDSQSISYQNLQQIGYNIGLIFQLTDDILGLFGQEDEMGKSNSSDIIEGKRTILMLRTYHKLTQIDKPLFKDILGNYHATEKQINWIKEKVVSTGALQEIREMSKELLLKINQDLDKYNGNTDIETRQIILNLSNYLVERRK